MIQSNSFYPKLRHFFDIQKRVGETYLLISHLVARLNVNEGTRRKYASEPGPRIVYKWCAAKKATG